MRVAIFVDTYVPYVNGVVTHVKVLKDGLEQLGHKVLIVTADINARHHYIRDGVLYCPAKKMKKLYDYGLASPISKRRMKFLSDFNPDIIHIQQEFGIGLSGIIAAKKLKKPLVYTLHSMYDEYILYVAPKPFVRAFTRASHKYFKYFADHATEITGPSKKVEEYFHRIGVVKNINVIPNTPELGIFSPNAATEEQKKALHDQYHIPQDVSIACFVGRMGYEKSLDVLLKFWKETIKKEDKLHLLLVGDGPSKSDFMALASELGIQDMVTFAGRIPHDELPPYYAACDVFVTASLSEVNSVSMLEAMASGLPVLQRLDRLNADQIIEGVNGYLFETAEEMGKYLKDFASKSPEEKNTAKTVVAGSVRSSGAIDLANYILTVYDRSIKEVNTCE